MRSSFTALLATLILLTAIASVAESDNSDSDGLMARLSYRSGGMVIDWRYQKVYPQICFAVYRSGYYRVSRLTEHGNETLEGKLPKAQLTGLDQVLNKIKFQSQGDGVQYLQSAESGWPKLCGMVRQCTTSGSIPITATRYQDQQLRLSIGCKVSKHWVRLRSPTTTQATFASAHQ